MPLPARSSDVDAPAEHPIPSDSLASTKVLGITELLEIILLKVPVEHLTALRPVARLWNEIISEINHIEPATIGHGYAHCRCLGTNRCAYMPHYASNIAIRGNPVFRYVHIYRGALKEHDGEETSSETLRHYRGIQLRSWDDTSDLDASANHFITDPPITLITVGGPRFRASLRVPTGIRVGDLRDVLAKLVGANGGYAKPSTARPIAWYASNSDIIRGSDDTGKRTAKHDGENDVGARIARLSFVS